MNITELKALAEKATPGNWEAAGPSFGDLLPRYCNEVLAISEGDEETQVCRYPDGLECECTDDMKFIAAANPAAILELIAQFEDAQGEIRALRDRVKELEKGLRRANDALDLLTDKVDGTGFAESDEFNNALDEIDLGRALLEKKE